MVHRGVAQGQRVRRVKLEEAKRLRRNMTPEEDILWAHLRRNQLPGWHFRRQQVIAGLIADFYCDRAGLVVELDGHVHANQREYDVERDRTLAAHGLQILRFRNEEIRIDLQAVLRQIQLACENSVSTGVADSAPLRTGEGPRDPSSPMVDRGEVLRGGDGGGVL
jgi:very-short-patch-repair endonuclease